MTNAPSVRVILASASPRRRELLDLIGIAHEVRPANVVEVPAAGEAPDRYAERLAADKAAVIASAEPDALVIAADTVVVVDGVLLEKPADPADAARMLRALSGRSHFVHTALHVRAGDRSAAGVETTAVTMRALDEQGIADYVATGEPLDKAGAYGIQGYGATLVSRIEGDYFTVMGLGLTRLVALVEALGYRYSPGRGVLRGVGGH